MTGTAWETVGWKETAAQARDPDKAKEDIKVFLKEFYKKKKKDPKGKDKVTGNAVPLKHMRDDDEDAQNIEKQLPRN